MFNVITETPAFLPDMSKSFMQNYHKSYMWITPYTTLEEAEEAAAYLRRVGSTKAVVTIEEV
jgi:hypothetical protein